MVDPIAALRESFEASFARPQTIFMSVKTAWIINPRATRALLAESDGARAAGKKCARWRREARKRYRMFRGHHAGPLVAKKGQKT